MVVTLAVDLGTGVAVFQKHKMRHGEGKEMRAIMRTMRNVAAILGLGLAFGCFGGCGEDLGTPKPDGGGGDGSKSQGDGGASVAEVGHSANDTGNASETDTADAVAEGSSVAEDSGIVDVRGTVDAPSNLDVTENTSLYPAVVDGGIVDAGDAPDVASDSSDTIDSSGLGLVIPQNGEEFSPPLPNATSLPSGAWYCDMGTAHWAQGKKGTGICPICGMDLVQKP